VAKGSNFEREICRKLSLWYSKGTSDELFWRSAMSGGMATVRRKKGQTTTAHAGDITAVDDRGAELLKHCVIECKRGYKYDLLDMVDKSKNRQFEDFLDQTTMEMEQSGVKVFMLIAQRDRRIITVTVPWVPFMSGILCNPSKCGEYVSTSIDEKNLFVLTTKLDRFLAAVDPDKFVEACKWAKERDAKGH